MFELNTETGQASCRFELARLSNGNSFAQGKKFSRSEGLKLLSVHIAWFTIKKLFIKFKLSLFLNC